MASARPERTLVKEVLKFLLASHKQDGQERVMDVFYSLARRTRESYRIARAGDLGRFLRNHSELFQVRRSDDGDLCVALTTTLGLCPVHSNRSHSCSNARCSDLHICTFFLLSGDCQFGRKCLFGHKLNNRHNRTVLNQHGLADLDMMELGQVLSLPWVRRGITVPKVCTFYNQLRNCRSNGPCRSFHLCLPYVRGQCKFKNRCKRNHDVTDPQVTETLASYGVRTRGRRPEDVLEEIRTYQESGSSGDDPRNAHACPADGRVGESFGLGAYRNRFRSEPNLFRGQGYQRSNRDGSCSERNPRYPSASRFPGAKRSNYTSMTSAASPFRLIDQLCLFHLQNQCRYGEDCRYLHSDHPFLWQVAELEAGRGSRRKVDLTWSSVDLHNNIQLETYFSQPNICQFTLDNFDGAQLEVNFKRFVAKSSDRLYDLRRIGTSSSEDPGSAGQSPSRMQTDTVWNWYWRDETERWNLFGLEDEGHVHLPWRSDSVERTFLTGPGTSMECGHFSLHFDKMLLIDLDSGRRFWVARRPQLPELPDDTDESDDESQSDYSDEEGERGDCARNVTGNAINVQAVDDVNDDGDGVTDDEGEKNV